eukprot:SAG31_NODE_26097_length_448_cov_1.054441_1_plen_25_part_01
MEPPSVLARRFEEKFGLAAGHFERR